MIQIKLITPDQTKPLRHLVLWPHIEREENCVIAQDHDPSAFHLGAFQGDDLIAIGSFFEMSSSKINYALQYRLRAMASHPDCRGSGAGKALLIYSLEFLRQKQIYVLWCDARLKAVGFYKGIGFQLIDEIYDVPIIGLHQFMYYPL